VHETLRVMPRWLGVGLHVLRGVVKTRLAVAVLEPQRLYATAKDASPAFAVVRGPADSPLLVVVVLAHHTVHTGMLARVVVVLGPGLLLVFVQGVVGVGVATQAVVRDGFAAMAVALT
jgi:hypothetical protein